jgi:hypothetical protein
LKAVSAANADPPVETLRRFVYVTDRLQTRQIIKDEDLRSSLTLSSEVSQPLRVTHHEPNEEHLRSYLLDFRKFVSESEPIFIYKVFNIAHQHITGEEIAASLINARRSWRDSMSSGDISFVENDSSLEPEHLIDLWINGYYFHEDPAKRAKLEWLSQVPMSRWLFINVLVRSTQILIFTAHAIKIALREGLVADAAVR